MSDVVFDWIIPGAKSFIVIFMVLNLAAMLLRSGLATDRRERLADPSAPLVIAGGASVGAAAALYGAQSGVDGLYVGDRADVIAELFRRCRDGRARAAPRRTGTAR